MNYHMTQIYRHQSYFTENDQKEINFQK